MRGELIDHIILKQIGSSKIFKHCPVSVLGAVAEYFEEVYLSPGEVLFNEGDDPDSMYIILYGDMELKKKVKQKSLCRGFIYLVNYHLCSKKIGTQMLSLRAM